jgi:hypothetical protein
MQNLQLPFFFLTNKTGEEKEPLLCWITPAYNMSWICFSISSLRAGAYLYVLEWTGAAPGSRGILW